MAVRRREHSARRAVSVYPERDGIVRSFERAAHEARRRQQPAESRRNNGGCAVNLLRPVYYIRCVDSHNSQRAVLGNAAYKLAHIFVLLLFPAPRGNNRALGIFSDGFICHAVIYVFNVKSRVAEPF